VKRKDVPEDELVAAIAKVHSGRVRFGNRIRRVGLGIALLGLLGTLDTVRESAPLISLITGAVLVALTYSSVLVMLALFGERALESAVHELRLRQRDDLLAGLHLQPLDGSGLQPKILLAVLLMMPSGLVAFVFAGYGRSGGVAFQHAISVVFVVFVALACVPVTWLVVLAYQAVRFSRGQSKREE